MGRFSSLKLSEGNTKTVVQNNLWKNVGAILIARSSKKLLKTEEWGKKDRDKLLKDYSHGMKQC